MNKKFYDLAKKIADWHTVTNHLKVIGKTV